MKKTHLLAALSIFVVLASCKKEDKAEVNVAIAGSYSLKSISAKTSSAILGSSGDKSVTTSDYTTTNNGGTITFDNSIMSSVGLTYSVNSTAKGFFYMDNVLVDTFSYPLNFTLPQSTSVANYQLIGADSIYFPNGGVTSGTGMSSVQSGASGGRYKLEGKLLTIVQQYAMDSTFSNSGETMQLKNAATATIVMEKP